MRLHNKRHDKNKKSQERHFFLARKSEEDDVQVVGWSVCSHKRTKEEPLLKQQVWQQPYCIANVALHCLSLCSRQLVRPRKTGILLSALQKSVKLIQYIKEKTRKQMQALLVLYCKHTNQQKESNGSSCMQMRVSILTDPRKI